MIFIRHFLLVSICVICYQSIALGIECPPFPSQVSKDWEVDVKTEVAKIGPVKGGELATKMKNATVDLMSKLPGAEKLYIEQMMFACYCSSLRDDSTLSESDKRKLLQEYIGYVRSTLYGSQETRASSLGQSDNIISLVNILKERANSINNDLNEVIVELEHYKGEKPEILENCKKLKELKNRFIELYQKHIEAVNKSDVYLSHELIGEIHEVLFKINTIVSSTLMEIAVKIWSTPTKYKYLDPPKPGFDREYDARQQEILDLSKRTASRTNAMLYPGQPSPNLSQNLVDLMFAPGKQKPIKDNNLLKR